MAAGSWLALLAPSAVQLSVSLAASPQIGRWGTDRVFLLCTPQAKELWTAGRWMRLDEGVAPERALTRAMETLSVVEWRETNHPLIQSDL